MECQPGIYEFFIYSGGMDLDSRLGDINHVKTSYSFSLSAKEKEVFVFHIFDCYAFYYVNSYAVTACIIMIMNSCWRTVLAMTEATLLFLTLR